MGTKRHKPEKIVTKLRQVEVLCGQGMPRVDAIRHGLLPWRFSLALMSLKNRVCQASNFPWVNAFLGAA